MNENEINIEISNNNKNEKNELNYPSESPYAHLSGYLYNLDENQLNSLNIIKEKFYNEKIKDSDDEEEENKIENNNENELNSNENTSYDITDLSTSYISEDLLFLKYLRANDFKIKETWRQILDTIKWRKEININELRNKTAEEILGCDPSLIFQYFPHWQCGFDRIGRPIVYQQYGGFQTWKLKKYTTLEKLLEYHIWEQENCQDLLLKQTKELNQIVETVTHVVDIKDMSIRQVGKDFLWLVRQLSIIDQDYYPESLGNLVIINTPSLFTYVWKGIKPWINERTTQKIHILASEKEWKPYFEDKIGRNNLSIEYGGLLDRNKIEENIDNITDDEKEEEEKDEHDLNIDNILKKSNDRKKRHKHRYDHYKEYDEDDIISLSTFYGNLTDEDDFHSVMKRDIDNNSIYTSNRNNNNNNNNNDNNNNALPIITEDYFEFEQSKSIIVKIIIKLSTCLKLTNKDIKTLSRYHDYTTLSSIVLGILLISFGSYVLTNMYWVSSIVQWVMWVAVVLIFLGCINLVISFLSYIANHSSYSMALFTCVICQFFLSFLLLIISIITFLSAANSNTITNISWKAVENVVPESVSKKELNDTLEEYYLMLGSSTLALGLGLFFQCIIGALLSLKYKARGAYEDDRNQQLRKILRTSNAITLTFGLVGIAYGSYALDLSLNYNLGSFVFTPYMLLLSGFGLTLLSFFGFWTSSSKRPIILKIYTMSILPLFLFTIIGAIFSFQNISESDKQIKKDLSDKSDEEIDSAQAAYKATLIVSGILELVISLFLFINVLVVKRLYQIVDRRYNLHIFQRDDDLLFRLKKKMNAFSQGSFAGFNRSINGSKYRDDYDDDHDDDEYYDDEYDDDEYYDNDDDNEYYYDDDDNNFDENYSFSDNDSLFYINASKPNSVKFNLNNEETKEYDDVNNNNIELILYDNNIINNKKEIIKKSSMKKYKKKSQKYNKNKKMKRRKRKRKTKTKTKKNRYDNKDMNFFTDLLKEIFHHSNIINDYTRKLTIDETILIIWAVITGCIHIFFEGTFVIFNRFIAQGNTSWFIYEWVLMGKSDDRYSNSDSFIVTSEGILSFLIGPLCFIYSWAIVNRRSFRHILGIVICIIQIHTQILYYGTEIHDNFEHTVNSDNTKNAFIWPCFLIIGLMRLFLPIFIIRLPFKELLNKVAFSDKFQLNNDNIRYIYSLESLLENEQNHPYIFNNNRENSKGKLSPAAKNLIDNLDNLYISGDDNDNDNDNDNDSIIKHELYIENKSIIIDDDINDNKSIIIEDDDKKLDQKKNNNENQWMKQNNKNNKSKNKNGHKRNDSHNTFESFDSSVTFYSTMQPDDKHIVK